MEKTSDVLAKIVELKVDNLSGPHMFTWDLDKIKDELRVEAIDEAKEKARVLAKELGVSLNKIVGFSEGSDNSYPRPIYRSYAKADILAEGAMSSPEINPGQDKIVKTVNITFQIED